MRDQRVHVGAKPARPGQAALQDRPAGDELDRRRQRQCRPARPVVLAETECQQHHRQRQRPAQQHAAQPGARLGGVLVARPSVGGAGLQPVADPLDRGLELGQRDGARVKGQARPVGGEVHARLRHTGLARQHTLDPYRARRAVHALDGELRSLALGVAFGRSGGRASRPPLADPLRRGDLVAGVLHPPREHGGVDGRAMNHVDHPTSHVHLHRLDALQRAKAPPRSPPRSRRS